MINTLHVQSALDGSGKVLYAILNVNISENIQLIILKIFIQINEINVELNLSIFFILNDILFSST